jgi:hypothetical protein
MDNRRRRVSQIHRLFPRTKSYLLFPICELKWDSRPLLYFPDKLRIKTSRVAASSWVSFFPNAGISPLTPFRIQRLNPFVGFCHLVEIWPFVSSCINAVTMRTIKGEQLCPCRDLRIFERGALRERFTGGHGCAGLNDARRPQKRADHRPGDQQSGNQSLYFDIHYEDTG